MTPPITTIPSNYDDLYKLYRQKLLSAAKYHLRCDDNDAQDAIQDIFLQLMEKDILAQFNPAKSKFNNYFWVMVKPMLRSLARTRAVDQVKYGDSPEEGSFDPEITTPSDMARFDQVQTIYRAINTLVPPDAKFSLGIFFIGWYLHSFSIDPKNLVSVTQSLLLLNSRQSKYPVSLLRLHVEKNPDLQLMFQALGDLAHVGNDDEIYEAVYAFLQKEVAEYLIQHKGRGANVNPLNEFLASINFDPTIKRNRRRG